jgi:hypothetical protein
MNILGESLPRANDERFVGVVFLENIEIVAIR